jgi:hypothetical protein
MSKCRRQKNRLEKDRKETYIKKKDTLEKINGRRWKGEN